jgi:beta-aspartyl-dipeptidase (metallo-type)
MPFILIHKGSLFTPQPVGKQLLLIIGEKIVKIGTIEAENLLRLGLPGEVIDTTGQLVIPGFIDPHAHLIGAGGEQGFTSRMPELTLAQLVGAGVTTVGGVLGSEAADGRGPRHGWLQPADPLRVGPRSTLKSSKTWA